MDLMQKNLEMNIKENYGQRKKESFSIPVAADIMLQIARGMENEHSRKTYHGELNPSNILLKASNSSSQGNVQAKVTAFGVTPIKSSIYRTKSGNQNGEILILRYMKKVILINPDHGQPDAPPPLVDYCDIETRYLNKFPEAGTLSLNSISQRPFQIFAYKLVEKEKTRSSLK
ncbi:hypothetical protein POM88_013806 [Heracleum sosnowskyi]|uniref:Protein kinase domain-containing protein n=1 Tax=Heracleum sosnowskyi TaxID=360622 RepID=A0AAD8J2V7_9APIA|nr:hypothetical protein POM88_013806 [Heracleum sosnowskyi]